LHVEFVSQANAELLSALQFYESESPGLSRRFLDDLERTSELVSKFPALGTPATAGTRRIHLRRFPYSLVYRRARDVIWVIAVEHHRRMPDRWVGRV